MHVPRKDPSQLHSVRGSAWKQQEQVTAQSKQMVLLAGSRCKSGTWRARVSWRRQQRQRQRGASLHLQALCCSPHHCQHFPRLVTLPIGMRLCAGVRFHSPCARPLSRLQAAPPASHTRLPSSPAPTQVLWRGAAQVPAAGAPRRGGNRRAEAAAAAALPARSECSSRPGALRHDPQAGSSWQPWHPRPQQQQEAQ